MALQTKTFSYGSLTDKSVLNGYLLELTVTEQSTDTVKNTSEVDFVLKLRSGSKNRFNLYGIGASVSLNGKVVGTRDRYEEDQVSLGYNSSVTLVKDSCTVAHNDDGTKTMAVAFSISMATGSYVPGPVSVTDKSMALTAIPRASTIAASDANIGAVSTVVVGRKSTAYTHTVAVTFGGITGYLNADGALVASAVKMTAATIPFAVPESFYGEIPNKASGKCTLTCTTYSGSNKIGEKTAEFTVTAAKSLCAPEVAISVQDVNEDTLALTGDENILVRYLSTARCFVSAQAKNAATIKSITVEGQAVEGEYVDFPNTEQGSFKAVCTDSRGYSGEDTATAGQLKPYVLLTCNPTAKRLSPTGGDALLTVKGNYYNGSFGAVENALTLTYRIGDGEPVPMEAEVTGNSYTAQIQLEGLDYTQSFAITVVAEDAAQRVEKTVTLYPGIPVFDWGQNDFSFHVPVSIQGNPLADFVVEQGTSGVWTYKKWASGIAECSGNTNVTVPEELTQSGSVYWSAPVYVDYPFEIFDAHRFTTIANVGILCAQLTETHTDKLSFRVICTNTGRAGATVAVHMYVRGRWK